MKSVKITIIGGGNIGSLMAAELANKGHEVTIYTSRPGDWNKRISVLDSKNRILLTGTLSSVTSDMKCAIEGADIIFITMPSQTFTDVSIKIERWAKARQLIGIIPGTGGAEFAFHSLIEKGCILFGFQRVHSIARLKEYGKSVYMLGRKEKIQIGAIPAKNAGKICNIIESLFNIECEKLENYLCVTLTPSNPILHTARLYSLFKDYSKGKIYSKNIFFYEEWDDDSSKILIDCDNELQKLCDVIPIDLKAVKPLKLHYESNTPEQMTNKIRSIEAFKGLMAPMKKLNSGWVPDFESRYFTSDFPYGLKIINDLAKIYSVYVPNINKVWKWYEKITGWKDQNSVLLKMAPDDLLSLYKK